MAKMGARYGLIHELEHWQSYFVRRAGRYARGDLTREQFI